MRNKFSVLIIILFSLFFTFSISSAAPFNDSESQQDSVSVTDEHAEDSAAHHAPHLDGKSLELWWIIPFLGILLSIAVFPLVAPHFWHHHFAKVSANVQI